MKLVNPTRSEAVNNVGKENWRCSTSLDVYNLWKTHFSSFWICGVAYIFGLQLCAHFDKLKWNIFKELTQPLCCLRLSLAFTCCQDLCCLSCMMWTWKGTNKIFCQVKSWNNGECLILKQCKRKKPIGCLCVFILVFSLFHMGQV